MRWSMGSVVTLLVGIAVGAAVVSFVGKNDGVPEIPVPANKLAVRSSQEPAVNCVCAPCPTPTPSAPATVPVPDCPPPPPCPQCPEVPRCPQCPSCEGREQLEALSNSLPHVFLRMKDMIVNMKESQSTEPLPMCTGPEKLAIVLPFRERDEHFVLFRQWMRFFLREQNVCFLGFYVIEQDDTELFDRGWLINIGYDLAKKDGSTYFVMHDVDALPMPGVPYSKPDKPLQLSAEQDRFKFDVIYTNYGGGVFCFTNEQYEKINGCSNDYHGWGAEDDDLYWRLRRNDFTNPARDFTPYRPARGQGVYVSLESHGHTARKFTPGSIRTARKWQSEMANGSTRWKTDGINSLKYAISGGPTREGDTVRVKVRRSPDDPHIGKSLADAEDARLQAGGK